MLAGAKRQTADPLTVSFHGVQERSIAQPSDFYRVFFTSCREQRVIMVKSRTEHPFVDPAQFESHFSTLHVIDIDHARKDGQLRPSSDFIAISAEYDAF